MSNASFKTATGSGHDCHFPPTKATEGSGTVEIEGKPALRVGDHFAEHSCRSCGKPSHKRALSKGSPSVFINGQPAGRIGDAIGCGGTVQIGVGDVSFDGE